MASFFDKYLNSVKQAETIKYTGSVCAVKGMLIESQGPRSVIGEMCTIKIPSTNTTVQAEVVGLEGTKVQLMAYGETKGIEIGCEVVASGHVLEVAVGKELLGRVIDATGKPYDGKGEIVAETYYPAIASSPNPLERKPIERRIVTGVRSIDSLLTVGKGQRMGIFAGSGVGKSTLISMIARNTNADVNVIGLIGERGREVLDFINRDLGEEGLKKSIVVVATGDQSAIARLRAAYVTTAIAEYFRDQGKDVMLMFDNITRFAKAQSEIANSTGEIPSQRGYPPSVFEMIPKLLERSGTNSKGSITAFYAVLVDGDDFNEPITDAVRGTLDGHVFLNRSLAAKQHYPAIDIAQSISRLSKRVSGPKTLKACSTVRKWMADYAEQEDMIIAGVYQKGNSPEIDIAIDKHTAIEEFLCQEEFDPCPIEDTLQKLSLLSGIDIPQIENEENPIKAVKDYEMENIQQSEITEQEQSVSE